MDRRSRSDPSQDSAFSLHELSENLPILAEGYLPPSGEEDTQAISASQTPRIQHTNYSGQDPDPYTLAQPYHDPTTEDYGNESLPYGYSHPSGHHVGGHSEDAYTSSWSHQDYAYDATQETDESQPATSSWSQHGDDYNVTQATSYYGSAQDTSSSWSQDQTAYHETGKDDDYYLAQPGSSAWAQQGYAYCELQTAETESGYFDAQRDPYVPAHSGAPQETSEDYYSPGIQKKYNLEKQSHKSKKHHKSSSALGPEQAADISYAFDERKYIKRAQAHLASSDLPTAVPPGWPEFLQGPLVWTASDFPSEDAFTYYLTDDDKEEIAAALEYFKTLGWAGKYANRDSFPLPSLQAKLRAIQDDVYDGRGFAILRGLDVNAYDNVDLVTVYLGLTSYVAEVRGKQNQKGHMLIHVVNSDDHIRSENAAVDMPYHTDLVCDVTATLTKSCGGWGGTPALASVWTVYNELAATRPDIIHVLAEPNWPFDTFNRNPKFYTRALLHLLQDGRVALNFSRRTLVGHAATSPTGKARTPGIPTLTVAQADALDTLHALGRQHEIQHSMYPGDIRFVNNWAVMHRRDRYEDDQGVGFSQGGCRHLLRLWLHSPDRCWPLPEPLRLAWDRVFSDTERPEWWGVLRMHKSGRLRAKRIWKGDYADDDDDKSEWEDIRAAVACD